MLSRLSAMVAPEIPPVEDLKHHWDCFLHYYATKRVKELKKEPIEQTQLTFHLNKILKILVEEQNDSVLVGGMRLSPSLEYLLHHNVLDVLVTLCQADSPPGIRPYIFNVFIFLVEQVRYSILAESAVHQPMRRLVLVCTLTKASPTESQEIRFITVLCGKIREKPDLIHIFLDGGSPQDFSVTPNSFDTSRQSSGRVSRDALLVPPNMQNIEKLAINVRAALDILQSKHLLTAALLNYLDSADYMLACTAMESLILVAGLDSDLASQALITGSPFLSVLLARLCNLFSLIPSNVDPARIEEVVVNWLEAHHFHSQDMDDPSFIGRVELVAFYSFVDYLDHLVRVSHTFTSVSLATEFREQFLEVELEPRVMSSNEEEILSGLALIAQTWLHIKSDKLGLSFSIWLLGDSMSINPLPHPLRDRLISLCQKSGPVGLESVRLFDVLLSLPCPYILDRLLMVYLEPRNYYLQSAHPEGHQINSWSDVEDEREKAEHLSEDQTSQSSRAVTPSRTLAPSNIHRLVNAWLYLVPDQLRLDEIRGSGYDQYVQDATKQLEIVAKDCASFDWPREAAFTERSETSSSDSRYEADPSRQFSEGKFLNVMFDKLSKMLDTDYDANLQLTSVFSRLAQLPHPHLHEYLLNPTITLVPGINSLYGQIKHVLAEAVKRSESIPHFPRKMIGCRRNLLGDNSRGDRDLESSSEEKLLLEAVLVIDEFCKELAAVTFVKYHCFS